MGASESVAAVRVLQQPTLPTLPVGRSLWLAVVNLSTRDVLPKFSRLDSIPISICTETPVILEGKALCIKAVRVAPAEQVAMGM